MRHFKIIILLVLLTLTKGVSAQCAFKNTAFSGGEFLTYNLYYNWKFVWVKAGNASMYTVSTKYNGHDAYRSSLTTRGNGRVDDFFVLRDTLLCYASQKLEPLYFRKGAREGNRYTVDEVWYTYPNRRIHLRQHRLNHKGEHEWKETNSDECVFDMMNIFLRARSFNPEKWKKGHVVKFPIADGRNVDKAQLKYNGKTTIKADDGNKYRCLQLSYTELDDGKWKEVARFYVTDDQNHIPVRLDMFLRFGSAKAFLVSMKGIRNKIESIVK